MRRDPVASPDHLLAQLARTHARPEAVCYAYVCYSPGLIPGGVSRAAWLAREDAERQRDVMLADLFLCGPGDSHGPDDYIQILELQLYKRGKNGSPAPNPTPAPEPVDPGAIPCPGQVVLRDDEGRRGP